MANIIIFEYNVEFRKSVQGDWQILHASGRIDVMNASKAEETLQAELGSGRKLALEMSGLDYISSACLRVLLRTAQKAEDEGKEFVLVGAAGNVSDVLEDSGMDMLLTIYDTIEDL